MNTGCIGLRSHPTHGASPHGHPRCVNLVALALESASRAARSASGLPYWVETRRKLFPSAYSRSDFPSSPVQPTIGLRSSVLPGCLDSLNALRAMSWGWCCRRIEALTTRSTGTGLPDRRPLPGRTPQVPQEPDIFTVGSSTLRTNQALSCFGGEPHLVSSH